MREETASFFAPLVDLHVALVARGGALASLRFQEEPGPASGGAAVEAIAARVRRHLETGREDLRDVPVDLAGAPEFHRRALLLLRDEVPPGQVTTYGGLAARLGLSAGASRAVGGAMAHNPVPLVLPCHRVLGADGRLGNYTSCRGPATKLALLRLEGVRLPDDPLRKGVPLSRFG